MFGLSALLFALNLFIAARLFKIEFLNEMDSIEGVFMAIAIHFREGHLSPSEWWPLWNLGMPFGDSYQPLLHAATAFCSWITGLSIPRAFHSTEAVLYAAGPVGVFLLTRRLTQSTFTGFLTALLWSTVSPSVFIFGEIRGDVAGHWLAPRRLYSMLRWGDGPHAIAVGFIPFALWALDRALERPNLRRVVQAILLVAIVPFTNWPGTIGFSLAAAALTASYCASASLRAWPRILLTLWAIALGSVFVLSFWTTPATVQAIRENLPKMESPNPHPDLARLGLSLAAGAFIIVAVSARRWRIPRAAVFFALFAIPVFAFNAFHYWLRTPLISQPQRFHLEMDLALCGLAAALLSLLPARPYGPIAAGVILFCAVAARQDVRFIRGFFHPFDPTRTSEYKVASWLREMGQGGRALMPGSIKFWTDVFAPVPLTTGCCDQNLRVPLLRVADFLYHSDMGAADPGEASRAWADVLGAKWTVAAGPRSTETFHEMTHPAKFEGLLASVWHDSTDDVIYEVYPGPPTLAHAVLRDELPAREPYNGIDIEPLAKLRSALLRDRAHPLKTSWGKQSDLTIEGDIPPAQIVSVQIAWNENWRALCDNAPCPTGRDKLSLVTVTPNHAGPQTIRLEYREGMFRRVSQALAALFALAALATAAAPRRYLPV